MELIAYKKIKQSSILFLSLGFLLFDISMHAQDSISSFDLTSYKYQDGLTAEVKENSCKISWEGESGEEIEVYFTIEKGTPVIKEMAIVEEGGSRKIISSDMSPEYRIVSGVRRVTQQQTEPLERLGIPITEEKLNEIKWNAFWDAPLFLDDEPPKSHTTAVPAVKAFLNHPGLPRKPEEINRATASYMVTEGIVTTNGARIELVFPGVSAGIFEGYLQFDFYKGSNLIRQMFVAKTEQLSAAFKYDAGLTGLSTDKNAKIIWRDFAKNWQNYQFGGLINKDPTTVLSSNRLLAAETNEGSIAAFPPPHSFYWARETEQNLGYSWYRKDNEDDFSFGIRQAELEKDPEFSHNFALYNARPGKWQQMPVFYYISSGSGQDAIESALKFTHSDVFKPLPGYKVMGHHYHVGLVPRLKSMGGINQRINDISTVKAVGMDIYSIIDGVRGPGRFDTGELFLKDLDDYYKAARSQSDKDLLVIPNDENSTRGRKPIMGGHYDILFSHPVYWRPERNVGEPLFENHPKYGTVYNIGTPADMMEMAEREDVLISMPHPNTKRSTGYPEAFKDTPQFLHENYFSLGYRWGMGIDASEKRLGEYRFLELWNEVNNWMAAKGLPPKFALAISESRSDLGERGKPPYNDVYGMSPVNYLKIDTVPGIDDMHIIIDAMKKGEFFITTGEVLIPFYEIKGKGNKRTLIVDVEWTFPLDFVEIVWGDGDKTDREVLSTSDLLPFSKKRFEIPFKVNGKKWIRFAAWDVASNGALIQPINLQDDKQE